MPDEMREVIFPNGVPIRMLEPQMLPHHDGETAPAISQREIPPESAASSTMAEGHWRNDEKDLQKQARAARSPEGSENLLQK